jgi:hypothetical protein
LIENASESDAAVLAAGRAPDIFCHCSGIGVCGCGGGGECCAAVAAAWRAEVALGDASLGRRPLPTGR